MNTKVVKMAASTKLKLASIPRTRCHKCNSARTYLNPMEKCWECGKKFCFDHLWGGLFKDGMSQNESLRDVCDECKQKYNYKQL